MTEEYKHSDLLFYFLFIGGGLLVGLLVKATLISHLKKNAHRSRWKTDEHIIRILDKFILFALGLTGFYLACIRYPISPEITKYSILFIKISAILICTISAASILVAFLNAYSARSPKLFPSISILNNIVRISVYVLGFLIILESAGISVTPILTALGIGGLAVALALQDTLSNLFAGLYILISKNINIGDYISLENNEEGYITDISWRTTTVRSVTNKLIVMPNSKLAASQITNFDLPDQENSVIVNIGVAYNSDLKKVEAVTLEVAEKILNTVEGGVSDFKPLIRYHNFGDFSIDFKVILRVKLYTDQYLIKHEFIKAIHERYAQEKIEIPFPVRTILKA